MEKATLQVNNGGIIQEIFPLCVLYCFWRKGSVQSSKTVKQILFVFVFVLFSDLFLKFSL